MTATKPLFRIDKNDLEIFCITILIGRVFMQSDQENFWRTKNEYKLKANCI
jgi:hypothetical protein